MKLEGQEPTQKYLTQTYMKRDFSLVYTAMLACNHVQPNWYTALLQIFMTKSREIYQIKKNSRGLKR